MSLLDTKQKQPGEKLDYDVTYEDWITPGDGISVEKITVTVDRPGLQVFTYTVSGGLILKIWLTGGTSGVTYKVTITTETDDGRIKQDEFKVKVRDI
ncbi:MAG: hypothetical protein WKF61_01085 [Luteimonas sp.]